MPPPSPLLLLTPLLSQTAFTTLAILEPISFQPFYDPSLSSASLRSWFAQFVWKGLYAVLCFGGISAGVGARAAWLLGGWTSGGAGSWYVLGTGFSAAHFLFGPWVGLIIRRLIDGKRFPETPTLLEPTWGVTPTRRSVANQGKDKEGEDIEDPGTKDELKRWLRLHYTRTVLADVPALVCFIKGAVEVFGA